jgi:hypothetical protein
VTVTVLVGTDAVTVRAVTPKHEQAEENRTTPEHGVAYAGREVGTTVTCLLAKSPAPRGSAMTKEPRFFKTVTVEDTVAVAVAYTPKWISNCSREAHGRVILRL